MRILFLTELYPPLYEGGHELQCKIIADEMSKRGHEVFVLTSKYGVDRKRTDGKILRHLHYFVTAGSGGLGRRLKQFKIALFGRLNYLITRKIIKELKPDIVYSAQLSRISIFPIKAIQKKDISIVHHLGSPYYDKLVRECIIEPNLLKRHYRQKILGFSGINKLDFDHIITVSAALKKQLVEAGFPESNISVIPRGVSSDLINRKFQKVAPLNKKQIRILYAGRITQEKGIHVAVESIGYLVNQLKKKNIIFDIVGESHNDYLNRLQVLINDLKIEKYVKFLGKISRDELLGLYKNYDVFLFPSFREGFAGVLLEAMSQGLSVVATDTGGTPELIKDGWNGFLVPPNDSHKMAEKINRLIENPSLRHDFRANGLSTIEESYLNEQIIDKIEDYLKNVVESGQDIRP